jgi:hypothetical protein
MPGSYDFVLLDEAREVARMAAAIRVLSAAASTPTMELQAAGAFVFLTESAASMIVSGALLEEAFPRGYTFIAGEGLDGPAGTIVKTLPAEAGALRLRIAAGDPAAATMVLPDTRQVPAILQLRCTFFADRCRISGTDILKDAVVPLALSIPKDQKFTRPITRVAFRIDEVRPVGAPHEFPPPPPASPPPVLATVRVKILARTEIAGLPRVGDEDFSVPAPADSAVQSLSLHARAKVISVDTVPREVATTVRTAEFDFQETMTTFEATFAVPVDQTPAGWQYAGRAIKVGAPFRFEGRTYGINGWIVDVRIGRSLPAAATQ